MKRSVIEIKDLKILLLKLDKVMGCLPKIMQLTNWFSKLQSCCRSLPTTCHVILYTYDTHSDNQYQRTHHILWFSPEGSVTHMVHQENFSLYVCLFVLIGAFHPKMLTIDKNLCLKKFNGKLKMSHGRFKKYSKSKSFKRHGLLLAIFRIC